MEKPKIRRVTIEDSIALQTISRKTFFETFAAGNTEANMKNYLEEGFSINKLRTELENPHSAFYFAELNSNIIGYLKINFGSSQTELKDEAALEIERIYVLEEYHGKQVGQALYEKAISIAKENKISYVWLGVWEENPRAIQFYKKNGFVEFDKHVFRLGDDDQTDIMMKLML